MLLYLASKKSIGSPERLVRRRSQRYLLSSRSLPFSFLRTDTFSRSPLGSPAHKEVFLETILEKYLRCAHAKPPFRHVRAVSQRIWRDNDSKTLHGEADPFVGVALLNSSRHALRD